MNDNSATAARLDLVAPGPAETVVDLQALLRRLARLPASRPRAAIATCCEALTATVADVCTVALLDEDGIHLRATHTSVSSAFGARTAGRPNGDPIDPAHPAWRAVQRSGSTHALVPKGDPIFEAADGGASEPELIALYLPIEARTQIVGVVCVAVATPRRLTRSERTVARAVASQLARVLIGDADPSDASAQRDPLTGLPNRTLLYDRLDHALAQAHRDGSMVGVMVCDLDRFKQVNDTLGHQAGDEVLVLAAQRISSTVRAGDTVCRTGGDEFVLVCPQIESEREVTWVAQRIVAEFDDPFDLGHAVAHTGVSVGVALSHPHEPRTASELVQEADIAMYAAKQRGRNGFDVFDVGMRERTVARLDLEGDLRTALTSGQLSLAYQPIVSASDGETQGMEALLRWNHPTRGQVMPGEFIELAEECGLIGEIGLWVTSEAIRVLQRWSTSPAWSERFLAVNVSGHQLKNRAFATIVREKLRQARLTPGRLQLDVTESTIVNDPEVILALTDLRAQGVTIALDDFGAGYSSLGSLRQLPIDLLKIDRSFITGIDRDPCDLAVVTAIVEMARALGIRCVAEGVERTTQHTLLQQLGCEFLQGFLFGVATVLPTE